MSDHELSYDESVAVVAAIDTLLEILPAVLPDVPMLRSAKAKIVAGVTRAPK